MDDAMFVRRFEGFRDLSRDGQRLGDGYRPAGDQGGEVLALDQFHDDRA